MSISSIYCYNEIIGNEPLGISYQSDSKYHVKYPVISYGNEIYAIDLSKDGVVFYFNIPSTNISIQDIYSKMFSIRRDAKIDSVDNYTTIHIKTNLFYDIRTEININDELFLKRMDEIKKKHITNTTINNYLVCQPKIKRDKLASFPDIRRKYNPKCIGKYNVTDYISKFDIDITYKTEIKPLCSFDIMKDLEALRKIDSAITGSILEGMFCAVLSNQDISFEECLNEGIHGSIQHQLGYTSYTDDEKMKKARSYINNHVFEYIKNAVKTLHVKSFTGEKDNAYFTLTKTFCLRSSPDLIINDNEIYDIKVRSDIKESPKQLFLYARGFEQNYGLLKQCGIINLLTNELIIYKFDDLHKDINDKPPIEFALSDHFNNFYEESRCTKSSGIKTFPKHDLEIVYCYSTKKEKKSKFRQFLKTREFVLNDPSINFDRIWTMPRDDRTYHAINTCYIEMDVTPANELEINSKQCCRFALSMFTTDTDVDFMKKFNYEKVFVLREIPIPVCMKDYVIQFIDLDKWNYDDYVYTISDEMKKSRIGKYIKINRYNRKIYENSNHDLYYRYGPQGKHKQTITSLMLCLDELFTDIGDERIKYED